LNNKTTIQLIDKRKVKGELSILHSVVGRRVQPDSKTLSNQCHPIFTGWCHLVYTSCYTGIPKTEQSDPTLTKYQSSRTQQLWFVTGKVYNWKTKKFAYQNWTTRRKNEKIL